MRHDFKMCVETKKIPLFVEPQRGKMLSLVKQLLKDSMTGLVSQHNAFLLRCFPPSHSEKVKHSSIVSSLLVQRSLRNDFLFFFGPEWEKTQQSCWTTSAAFGVHLRIKKLPSKSNGQKKVTGSMIFSLRKILVIQKEMFQSIVRTLWSANYLFILFYDLNSGTPCSKKFSNECCFSHGCQEDLFPTEIIPRVIYRAFSRVSPW